MEGPKMVFGGIEMPAVRFLGGSECVLVADWHVEGLLQDGRVLYLDIKAGFTFDGASIPRALWRVCGHPLEAPRIAAALAHDWLYASKAMTRADADMIYRTICEWVGIGAFSRNVEYGALRLCGWKAWKEHMEADKNFALAHGVLELGEETKKEK